MVKIQAQAVKLYLQFALWCIACIEEYAEYCYRSMHRHAKNVQTWITRLFSGRQLTKELSF